MKLLKAKLLIDGTGRPPITDGCILVSGGRIVAVGGPSDVPTPPEAEMLDLGEGTLLLGLIDVHGHLSLDMSRGDVEAQLTETKAERLIRAVRVLQRNLHAGVTIMRIVGESRTYIDVICKRAVEEGRLPGPRLLVSGKVISASHGHGLDSGADGKDEVRRAVRDNLRAGADLVKVMATGGISSKDKGPLFCSYSYEEIATIVEEAHRVGKRVAAHAHGGPGLRYCLEAGVDTIEHGAYVTDDEIALFLETKTWLVGTFGILFHPDSLERAFAHAPSVVEKVRKARMEVPQKFKRAVDAGVRYTVGSDSMQGHLVYELECLVNFALDPLEAIVVATNHAAKACGLETHIGTLKAGKWADIIGAEGNPSDDITALRTVALRMKGGELYRQHSLFL